MNARRTRALAALATIFAVALSSSFFISRGDRRSRERREWLTAQAAHTRALGYGEEYSRDDARVYALSEFMDQGDAEFAEAVTLYQRYAGAERARLARYTCSALMDWARSPRLTRAKRDAAECTLCDLVTEYIADPALVGPLFGCAMELRLGGHEYLRHMAYRFVDDPGANRETVEFVTRFYLNNPLARAEADGVKVAAGP